VFSECTSIIISVAMETAGSTLSTYHFKIQHGLYYIDHGQLEIIYIPIPCAGVLKFIQGSLLTSFRGLILLPIWE